MSRPISMLRLPPRLPASYSSTEARLTFHQRLMDQLTIEHRRKAA